MEKKYSKQRNELSLTGKLSEGSIGLILKGYRKSRKGRSLSSGGKRKWSRKLRREFCQQTGEKVGNYNEVSRSEVWGETLH